MLAFQFHVLSLLPDLVNAFFEIPIGRFYVIRNPAAQVWAFLIYDVLATAPSPVEVFCP